MVKEEYITKDVKLDYKSKDYKVAVSPAGNQYALKPGQADEMLKMHGFKNATEAKKHGWVFK